MNLPFHRVAAPLAAVVLLAGCAEPKTLYYWGQYEHQVYLSYSKPDKATVQLQVQKMEEDYQKARSKNKPMHPGFHAHLGTLYYELGKADQARQEFQTEKEQFPESAVFMDRLLAKLAPSP
jgi:hypothetical protein